MSTPHPLAPEARLLTAHDLAGLILALAIVGIPHALRAPWWLALLTLALYGWRALVFVWRQALPARWLLLVLALVAMFGVWTEYRTVFGRIPAIVLLLLLSGLKLMETRTHRDAAAVVFLCYFLLITNFLYTQGIAEALVMCLALAVITVTVVGFSAPQRSLRANARSAAILLGHAAPAALLLFLLFPRVPGPMWGLPQDAQSAVTGLNDTMTPGSVAELAQSDALAFRAEFAGPIPPPRQRYWRGPILSDFDGRTWHAGPSLLSEREPRLRGGTTVRYSVLLEAHHRHWLFALESPAQRPQQANFSSDGYLLSTSPVRVRLRYEMVSIMEAQPDPSEDALLLRRALRLPAGYNPKAKALAGEWRAASATDGEIVLRAVDFFRRSAIAYTLEPPALGHDSVDEFLFSTRAGFCEHFASAFVFLMRSAGLPARVVTGYLGGDPNPIDGILTVRQSDAHAWVEVFLAGRGWLRVDPTAAAVPTRLESGLARSVPGSAALPLLMRQRLEWLRGMRYNWEALVHRWNVWVLGYNPERQREFMSWFGMPRADWRDLAAALLGTMCLFAAVLLAWSLWRRTRPDPVQSAWLRFCNKLDARGLSRAPHEGPRDFADRAVLSVSSSAPAIRRISDLYVALRYGKAAAPAEVAELQRLVRTFNPA
jgi:transglutaminase-like putative cysteine protease